MMQFLIMSHVAVADLNETETCTRVRVARCGIRKAEGLKDSAEQNAERARASPRHALEKTPTIDAIVSACTMESWLSPLLFQNGIAQEIF
jgi:hypothetical protein